jgi:hypothetical protein
MATIPQLHTRILHTPKEDKPSLEKGPSSRIIERRLKEAEICARNGGLLKILNEALLAEKYGEDVLPEEIEILNLSCSGIERMVNFSLLLLTQLTICDLGDNYLTSIAPLDACPNLMKLDVSNNQIACLPPREFWGQFSKLVALFLHNNDIHHLHEVVELRHCRKLHILTLSGTPVSLTKGYRHAVVNSIQTLKALDSYVVSDEEVVENFTMTGKFATFSKELKLKRGFTSFHQASVRDELQSLRSLLCYVNRIIAKCSPIAIVQRYSRGWLARRRLKAEGITLQRNRCEALSPRTQQVVNPSSKQVQSGYAGLTSPREHGCQRSTPIHIIVKMQNVDDKAGHLNSSAAPVTSKAQTDEKLKRDLHDTIEQSDVVTTKTVKPFKPKALGYQLNFVPDFSNSSDIEDDPLSSESERENEECSADELRGKRITLKHCNPKGTMKVSRKLDCYFARKATARIESMKASEKVLRIPPSCDLLTKDDIDFRRLHGTMDFSVLMSVSKAYRNVKAQDGQNAQRSLVLSRMQQRLEAKRKIDDFHEKKKQEISQWKEGHNGNLQSMFQHNLFEDELKREVHRGTIKAKYLENKVRKTESHFVQQFNVNNSTVADSLKREDNQQRCKEILKLKQASVKEDRNNALVSRMMVAEQQEEKAELARLQSSKARLELMREKYKAVMERQTVAKEKVAKVKNSLTSGNFRKVHKPTPGSGVTADLGPIGGSPIQTDLTGNEVYPNVLNLSMADADVPLQNSPYCRLPAGRILRHCSSPQMIEKEEVDFLPLMIDSILLSQRD